MSQMRSTRLLALGAAMAIAAAPLAMGTAASADNDNSKRPDGAGPPAQSQVQNEHHHRKSIGITKLAFAGPEADDVTKIRELDVTAGDVTVKVIVQFKAKDAVKPTTPAAAQWKTTLDGVETPGAPDVDLARKGKAKRVSNWHGSLTVPQTTVNGTVYCLTGATVDEVEGVLNLSKGQAKRSCFTVVSATLPPVTP
jgi:hypothetical protein